MNEEIRQRTKWFMDARFGMFIHWGLILHSCLRRVDDVRKRNDNRRISQVF